jgi:hypothetical protein
MPRLVIVLLLLGALLAGGCALVEPAATGPLVTIETRGGECPQGACGARVAIERDGRLHRLEPDPGEMASLPADIIASIDGAIRATDFADLRSRPFTGECPVNVDGQETIYEFSTPSGVERIASCEVEIDPAHPLFLAVEAALGATPP